MSALDELVQRCGFEKIEALTQYPKILSYHKIDHGHVLNQLNELPNNYQPLPTQPEKLDIVVQEKVEGQLSKIIIFDNDFFIGSDSIIYAKNDRISSSPIIAPVLSTLSNFFNMNRGSLERLFVLYGQTYGEGLYHSERYTKSTQRNFCVFDAFSISAENVINICLNNTAEDITDWVNNLQQSFFSLKTLTRFCGTFRIPQVPILYNGTLDTIPQNKNDTLKWLLQYTETKLLLDNQSVHELQKEVKEEDNKIDIDNFFTDTEQQPIEKKAIDIDSLYKKSAGVIIRTPTRSYIRSLSFDNYLHSDSLRPDSKEKLQEGIIGQDINGKKINIFTDIFNEDINDNINSEKRLDDIINNSRTIGTNTETNAETDIRTNTKANMETDTEGTETNTAMSTETNVENEY